MEVLLERVDSETREKIDKLLALYNQSGGGIPTDLEILINCLRKLTNKKVAVEFAESPQLDGGLLIPVKGGFRVLVGTFNDPDPFEWRIIACHEIAHILFCFVLDGSDEDKIPEKRLDRDSTALCRDEKIENICDEIAMYLLYPPAKIEKFLRNEFHRLPHQLELFRKRQKSPKIARLEAMARIFEMSKKHLIGLLEKQFNGQRIRDIFAQFSSVA